MLDNNSIRICLFLIRFYCLLLSIPATTIAVPGPQEGAYGRPQGYGRPPQVYGRPSLSAETPPPPPPSNPCNPSPCGPNSKCRKDNEQPVCSCLPKYIGSPPECRPECVVSSDCPSNRACINQKCRDPCPGTCGQNANCKVINHSPVCSCGARFEGDPFVSCYPINGGSGVSDDDPIGTTTIPIVTTTPIVTSSPIVRTPTTGDCEKSITTVNGVSACSKSLIFESNFENKIDKYWSNEVHFNRDESEFVVFDNISVNVYCESNFLTIRPTLLDDYYGEKYTRTEALDLTTRCTSTEEESCRKDKLVSTILPPVMSARLTTKESFSFKYGVVEIKAKLPRGDWVIPEIWLHPKVYRPYGIKSSGRVILAKSIGNSDLNHDGISIGNNLLTAGLQVNDKTRTFRKKIHEGLWSDKFHVYRLNWTPNGLKFSVDGTIFGEWFGNRNSPLLQDHEHTQRYGPVSPFDQEFYLLLGVHVGGHLDIPNGAVSGDHTKPWSNTDPKRKIRFFDDLKNWYGTWNDNTKLQVEYIKVWSL